MAKGGKKPTPPALRSIKGGKKSDNTDKPGGDGEDSPVFVRGEPLKPPKKLTKPQQAIWDRWIEPAWWLNDCDVPLAYQWVQAFTEFVARPNTFTAAEKAEMRRTFSAELKLSSSERPRIPVPTDSKQLRGAKEFFSR